MIFNSKTLLVPLLAASAMAMPNAMPEPGAMPLAMPEAMAMAKGGSGGAAPAEGGGTVGTVVDTVTDLIPSIIDIADKAIAAQGSDVKLHDVQPTNPQKPTDEHVKEQIACFDQFLGGGYLSWDATMECGGKRWEKHQKNGYHDVAFCEDILAPHIRKAIAQGFTDFIAEHYATSLCSCWISV